MLLGRWLANLTRVLMLAVIFSLIFCGSAMLIALLVSWFRGDDATAPENLYAGLVCGLIFWLFVAVMHLRRETLRLPFVDRAAFLKQMHAVLAELGYERHGEAAASWYRPSFRSYLLGGRVRLDVNGSEAVLTGPRFFLELLRKSLRIRSQLDNVQQAIRESRRRQGERLLSRVQLNVRVPVQAWSVIREQVLLPLAREGDLSCELNVLIQNAAGIRENVAESVHSWLAEHDIVVEMHRDYLMRDEANYCSPLPCIAEACEA